MDLRLHFTRRRQFEEGFVLSVDSNFELRYGTDAKALEYGNDICAPNAPIRIIDMYMVSQDDPDASSNS